MLTLDTKKEEMEFADHSLLLKRLALTGYSDAMKSIIESCLTAEPGPRPDARPILYALGICVTKGDSFNLVSYPEKNQFRTLSSPGLLVKLYTQKKKLIPTLRTKHTRLIMR